MMGMSTALTTYACALGTKLERSGRHSERARASDRVTWKTAMITCRRGKDQGN
jgi:hypothetical protein